MKTSLYLVLAAFLVLSACKKKETSPVEEPEPVNACGAPINLSVFTTGPEVTFRWEAASGSSASYYQFEYGPTGFAHGSGTVGSTSATYTNNVTMSAGNAYQFYVRGYCDATGGFSDWAGPFSYFTNTNHNMCLAPGNVQFTIETNAFSEPIGANMTWSHNGETNFECVMVANNAAPESGNIQSFSFLNGTPMYSLAQNTEYDFYIRAVCQDGNKTSWVGPKNVNIGG